MPQSVGDTSGGRAPDGKFLPGFGGRPKGSKNKVGRLTLAAVQALGSDAVAQLKIKVREGESWAVRLVLDYTLPRGGRTIDLDGSADPNSLIDAATTGDISPDEFARMSQGWKVAGDASDLQNIKAQVEELEQLVTALRK